MPQAEKSAFVRAPEGNAAKQSPEKRSGALPRRTAIAQRGRAGIRVACAFGTQCLPQAIGTPLMADSMDNTGQQVQITIMAL
ncbi:hypothetical protein NIES4073_24460 [Kalymmatonema gypsitolerans NIES-4073]|nr:hypothetical protein NIES4073_24460 [Scytonema sp. NIES-4073]